MLIIPNAAVTPHQDLDETAIEGEECVGLTHEENSSNQQTTQNVTPSPIITRSGRVVRKPKLNLNTNFVEEEKI